MEEAKNGTLAPDKIDYVAQQLFSSKHNLYTIIHILGRAKAIRYKVLIEPFLYYPDEPMVAKITLQTLCTYWDLTRDYLDQVKMFLRGVAWDNHNDVLVIAISIAGEYLRSTKDAELCQCLVYIFENSAEHLKSFAYYALARASGKHYNQIPNTEDILDQLQENSLDLSIIEQAKAFYLFC